MTTSFKSAGLSLRPLNAPADAATIRLSPGDNLTVGRSMSADVVIDDASLSRMHARLTVEADGELAVADLGSTNGVFINGERQAGGTMRAGDRLRLGRLEYLVQVEEEGEIEPAPEWEAMTRIALGTDAAKRIDRVALEGLLATSRELMACQDLPVLLEHVLDRLGEILRADRAAILFYDPITDALRPAAVRPAGAYGSVSEFASSTVVRESIASREVLALVDVRADARFQRAESVMSAGVRSVICAPLLGRTGPVGALYADRLTGIVGFDLEAIRYTTAFAAHAATALETAKLYADRETFFRATLEAFAKALEARDPYTRGHSERVTAYTLMLAEAAGLDALARETIRRAGLLHDIGKVGVPDAVLRKAGPLDAHERRLMEAHVTIGHEMLSGLPFLTDTLPSIRSHHERWDGRGYPDGLAGEAIHPHARLMGVADSYDAMTSDRPYRAALPHEEAARRIRADLGKQFAPEAVAAFDEAEGSFAEGREAEGGRR